MWVERCCEIWVAIWNIWKNIFILVKKILKYVWYRHFQTKKYFDKLKGKSMKIILSALLFITFLFGESSMSIYDIEVKDINGKAVSMSKYKDKVMLIVNVASKMWFYKPIWGD